MCYTLSMDSLQERFQEPVEHEPRASSPWVNRLEDRLAELRTDQRSAHDAGDQGSERYLEGRILHTEDSLRRARGE